LEFRIGENMEYSDVYMSYMGMAPKKIPHWEHWSCPDAETYLTGIDYYEHPRLCRLKLQELYPQLGLGVPATDDPIPRPTLDLTGQSSRVDEQGRHHVRWGDSETSIWDWGMFFKDAEDVFKFSPLEQGDFTNIPVVESRDYSDEEKLYEMYRKGYPTEWGDKAPEGSTSSTGFYNTMFMWPLLTFGWKLFLETCLDPRFERIMDEFAEINRRVFRSFARLPVNFVVCHDDIVTSRGPTCSPKWMHKYIFPRYEEFWVCSRRMVRKSYSWLTDVLMPTQMMYLPVEQEVLSANRTQIIKRSPASTRIASLQAKVITEYLHVIILKRSRRW